MATRPDESPKLTDTLTALGQDVPRLLRSEIGLLKAEVAASASRLAQATGGIVAGLLIGAVALLVVVQALVLALALHMPGWLASTIVGVLLAAVALVLLLKGRRDIAPEALLPSRTIEAVKKDKAMVEEKL